MHSYCWPRGGSIEFLREIQIASAHDQVHQLSRAGAEAAVQSRDLATVRTVLAFKASPLVDHHDRLRHRVIVMW